MPEIAYTPNPKTLKAIGALSAALEKYPGYSGGFLQDADADASAPDRPGLVPARPARALKEDERRRMIVGALEAVALFRVAIKLEASDPKPARYPDTVSALKYLAETQYGRAGAQDLTIGEVEMVVRSQWPAPAPSSDLRQIESAVHLVLNRLSAPDAAGKECECVEKLVYQPAARVALNTSTAGPHGTKVPSIRD